MAFLSENDILVLEKDKGTVMRVIDGEVQPGPLLDVNVATEVERCMCGIAVSQNNDTGKTFVFLYYTEAEGEDGGTAIGNRLYRYEFEEDGSSGSGTAMQTTVTTTTSTTANTSIGRLVNPKLLLDLSADPGPRHNGGAITIGPDNNLYIPIGDTDKVSGTTTESQNNDQLPADGTGGILRITQDGEPVIDPSTGTYILGNDFPLNLYYAYGIRNSFGIGFDPVTGNLWDSENGPGYGDEINLVEPGFNSGWGKVMGVWERGGGDPREEESTIAPEQPDTLVDFDGIGHYHSPQLTWLYTVGPTAIKFLNSDKYGNGFKDDMFVGDIHNGNIYHFKLNADRTELLIPEPLDDKVVDSDEEANAISFATGFAGISDIEVSPFDGYMYVVSLGQGKIFKIVPTGEEDTAATAGGTTVPSPPPNVIPPPIADEQDEDDTEGQGLPEQDEDDVADEDDGDDNDDDDRIDENQDEDED
jgi:glucose/arabinose dehydrogenase